MDFRRSIPSVDRLLASHAFSRVLERHPRALVLDALQAELALLRDRLASGGSADFSPDAIAATVERLVAQRAAGSLRTVLNATGVVLHTNLGRAPLADAAIEAMVAAAASYTNLEYDLDIGARGSRYTHCRDLLTFLTGADDALVVNNNAAAVVLALNTLARDRDAIISRGELVEIGGAFRVPEIMSRSGARLHEVGSTNRTHLHDYRDALSSDTGVLLKVHPANFSIAGYTAEVSAADLGELGRAASVPLVHDVGSGLMLPPGMLGLPHDEPWVREAVKHADVVTFSGDKLLGGPQCGIVAGRTDLIERMRRNPLCRAFRVDKLTLAALSATLRLYLEPTRALQDVPVLRMISTPPADVEKRATHAADELSRRGVMCDVVPVQAATGGGASPAASIPSYAVRLHTEDAGATEAALRAGDTPVIGRIQDGRVLLDMRTIRPSEDTRLVELVTCAMAGTVVPLSGNGSATSGDSPLTPVQG